MRLIDADALKDSLVNAHINRVITFDINTFRCVMNCIDNAPTVKSDYEWGYSEGVHDTERAQEKPYQALKIHVDSHTSCLDCPYNGVDGDCLEALHKDILSSFYGEFHNE